MAKELRPAGKSGNENSAPTSREIVTLASTRTRDASSAKMPGRAAEGSFGDKDVVFVAFAAVGGAMESQFAPRFDNRRSRRGRSMDMVTPASN